jgi:hypothetical protein
MLQLSDANYDTTTTRCFRVNFDVLTNKDAFQKNVIFCKKVSFDPFKDIIYIPKYNKEYVPHLWWSMSELTYIHEQVKQEIIIIMNNSLINIDMKCALNILCKYND